MTGLFFLRDLFRQPLCCFRNYFVWMGLLGFCRKRDWFYSRHIRNFRNMSRMRVKGDWEDVVEFLLMGLGKFWGRGGIGFCFGLWDCVEEEAGGD